MSNEMRHMHDLSTQIANYNVPPDLMARLRNMEKAHAGVKINNRFLRKQLTSLATKLAAAHRDVQAAQFRNAAQEKELGHSYARIAQLHAQQKLEEEALEQETEKQDETFRAAAKVAAHERA